MSSACPRNHPTLHTVKNHDLDDSIDDTALTFSNKDAKEENG